MKLITMNEIPSTCVRVILPGKFLISNEDTSCLQIGKYFCYKACDASQLVTNIDKNVKYTRNWSRFDFFLHAEHFYWMQEPTK